MRKFFILSFFLFPFVSFASSTVGTIGSSTNAAWSNNIGWVNFAPANGGLVITDTAVTGSAWSPNYGWINFTPTNGGVENDGQGDLSGTAWGDNTGWISFSGVSIDTNGIFHGQATGTIVGTLTFDCSQCDVATDWRPASIRNAGMGESGGGSGGTSYPLQIQTSAATLASTSTSTASANIPFSLVQVIFTPITSIVHKVTSVFTGKETAASSILQQSTTSATIAKTPSIHASSTLPVKNNIIVQAGKALQDSNIIRLSIMILSVVLILIILALK